MERLAEVDAAIRLPTTAVDAKVKLIESLHGDLVNLTPSDVETVVNILKTTLKAPQQPLAIASLRTLPLLFPLITSDANLKHALANLLPVQQLADSKERIREAAREACTSAARCALALGAGALGASTAGKEKENSWGLVSRVMQEQAFQSKNAKAREQALLYVQHLRPPLSPPPHAPLRPHLPLLLSLLADSDPTIRSLSLSTTISIFSAPEVPAGARSELKKALEASQISPKIIEAILSAVLGGASSKHEETEAPARPTLSASTSSAPGSRRAIKPPLDPDAPLPSTAFPTEPLPTTGGDVKPVYCASDRDVANEVEAIKAPFEGKETEHNWLGRERGVMRLRGLVKADVAKERREAFLTALKGIQDGLLKTSSSGRTTLATSTLSLFSEISTSLGHHFDSFLEVYLNHTLSMIGQTKKIIAVASLATCTTLIENAGYHVKQLHWLDRTSSDKIALTRAGAAALLGTFISTHGRRNKQAFENSGGLDLVETMLKRQLGDATPATREHARKTYWAVATIWPRSGEKVMASLDATGKKQLEKANPSGTTSSATSAASGASTPTAKSRPSVRQFIMQAKASIPPSPQAMPPPAVPTPRAVPGAARPPPTSPAQSASTASGRKTPVRVAPRPSFPTSPSASLSRSTPSRIPLPASPPGSVKSAGGAASSKAAHGLGIDTPRTPKAKVDANTNGRTVMRTPAHSQTASINSLTSGSVTRSPDLTKRGTEPSLTSIVAPLPDAVVDDALRSQAAQAEQAAQQFLELADEEGVRREHLTPVETNGISARNDVMRSPVGKLARADVFKDSPDARDGGVALGVGKSNWWARRAAATASRQDGPSSTTDIPPERLEQIREWVDQLSKKTIGSDGLKGLASVSRERPVRDDDSDLDAAPARNSMWSAGKLFDRLFSALSRFLRDADVCIHFTPWLLPSQVKQIGDRKPLALLLLGSIVENQSPCFSGNEPEVYKLLFELREDHSRSTVAAVDAIADVFVEQLEPLYGLGVLRASLEAYLSRKEVSVEVRNKTHVLGLRLLASLLKQLPSEILEDELPKVRSLIKTALNDADSSDLRRAAILALVAAQNVLRDENRLELMMDGLQSDQRHLLAYYAEKDQNRG